MAGTFQEEYDALSARIGTVYDVAQGIGATDPMPAADQRNTWNLSSYVASIRQQPVQDDWCLPVGWPDLRKVIEDDPFKNRTGVVGRCVLLIDVLDNGLPGVKARNVDGRQTWGWFNINSTCQYSVGYRTSNDPSTFVATTTADTQYTWDSSKYIEGANGRKFVWIEVYYNRARAHVGWSSGDYTLASAWQGLVWICGDNTSFVAAFGRFARRLVAVTGFTYINLLQYNYEMCGDLKTIPEISVGLSANLVNALNGTGLTTINFKEGGKPLSATSYNNFASTCLSLKEAPDILFEGNQLTSVNTVFSTCTNITRYPDTLDFSKVSTNTTNFWNYCNYLRQYIDKLPSKMIFPDALTLSCQFNQMGGCDYDTLARFDENGQLSGGWLYGWTRNPGWTTALSVKFQTSPVSWMTAQQKAEVSSYLLNRGFYVYGL